MKASNFRIFVFFGYEKKTFPGYEIEDDRSGSSEVESGSMVESQRINFITALAFEPRRRNLHSPPKVHLQLLPFAETAFSVDLRCLAQILLSLDWEATLDSFLLTADATGCKRRKYASIQRKLKSLK